MEQTCQVLQVFSNKMKGTQRMRSSSPNAHGDCHAAARVGERSVVKLLPQRAHHFVLVQRPNVLLHQHQRRPAGGEVAADGAVHAPLPRGLRRQQRLLRGVDAPPAGLARPGMEGAEEIGSRREGESHKSPATRGTPVATHKAT